MIIFLFIYVGPVTGQMLLPKNVMLMSWNLKKHGNNLGKLCRKSSKILNTHLLLHLSKMATLKTPKKCLSIPIIS